MALGPRSPLPARARGGQGPAGPGPAWGAGEGVGATRALAPQSSSFRSRDARSARSRDRPPRRPPSSPPTVPAAAREPARGGGPGGGVGGGGGCRCRRGAAARRVLHEDGGSHRQQGSLPGLQQQADVPGAGFQVRRSGGGIEQTHPRIHEARPAGIRRPESAGDPHSQGFHLFHAG